MGGVTVRGGHWWPREATIIRLLHTRIAVALGCRTAWRKGVPVVGRTVADALPERLGRAPRVVLSHRCVRTNFVRGGTARRPRSSAKPP